MIGSYVHVGGLHEVGRIAAHAAIWTGVASFLRGGGWVVMIVGLVAAVWYLVRHR